MTLKTLNSVFQKWADTLSIGYPVNISLLYKWNNNVAVGRNIRKKERVKGISSYN